MISNIGWRKLQNLMRDCWIENNAIQSNSSDLLYKVVVPGSIPILWFGDLECYANSEKRVVTIGINPSRREFGHIHNNVFTSDLTLRFPISKSSTVPNLDNYICAMSQYFRNNPLLQWFWPNEIALNACGSTYGGGKVKPYKNAVFSNVGLHIDVVSPLATKPWGYLNSVEQKELIRRFKDVFIRLVKALDPDILISPVKLLTYFPPFKRTSISTKKVSLKSSTYCVNKMKGNIGGKNRLVIEGWNGSIPFPFVSKSDIYSAIH